MKRLCLVLSVLVLTAVVAHAAGNTVVGVVTKVEPGTIEVNTDSGQTTSVSTDSMTTYRKWILAKPWGQDARADAAFVQVGKRVHIEAAKDNPSTARTVWIVVGRVGYP